MKKENKQFKSKTNQKNPTTNYPKDSHKAFCNRCYEGNKRCINTGSKRKDRECRL